VIEILGSILGEMPVSTATAVVILPFHTSVLDHKSSATVWSSSTNHTSAVTYLLH